MKTQQTAQASVRGDSPFQAMSDQQTTGLLPGTIILTQKGEVPVEALQPGDRIITRDAGFVALQDIHTSEAEIHTIRILAGSLGDTRPEEDLDLPADQKILVRDWRAKALFGASQALAEIRALVDGEFISDQGRSSQHLHHLAFDAPHIIYAGGIEVEIGAPLHPELRDAA